MDSHVCVVVLSLNQFDYERRKSARIWAYGVFFHHMCSLHDPFDDGNHGKYVAFFTCL